MSKQELQTWISSVFHGKLENISVTVSGTSEKGDGYVGDIVFATVTGTDCKTRKSQELPVVLKCSKRSDELRAIMPVQDAFLNEIAVYENILPAFRKFEREHDVLEQFNSVPHFYGSLTSDSLEVLVFENLKVRDFDLLNRREPMPKHYLLLVVREYAKFHAISVAMRDQQPQVFLPLTKRVQNMFKRFVETNNLTKLMISNMDEIHNLLRDDLDQGVLDEWNTMRTDCEFLLTEFVETVPGLNVICHGDSWCNNFMFKSLPNGQLQVAILDWQISQYSSPVKDLSSLIFLGISEEDLESLDYFLDEYYTVFSARLAELGSSNELYSKGTFLNDWKKYCKYGLFMTNMIVKICLTEKDDAPDLLDSVNENIDVAEAFSRTKISNVEGYKARMSYLIKYAFKEKLLQ